MNEKAQVNGLFWVKTPVKVGEGGVKVQSIPRNDRPPNHFFTTAKLEVSVKQEVKTFLNKYLFNFGIALCEEESLSQQL